MKKGFINAFFYGMAAVALTLCLSCNVYDNNGSLVDPGDPDDVGSASTGGGSAGVPTISASPTVLAADGSSKSVITVQVRNKANNPIVGGIVQFTSDAGVITGMDSTNAEGKATATLTSEKRNTTANITAKLSGGASGTVKIAVEFSGVSITATATPETIKPDGKDSTTLLAVVLDASNNPIVGEKVTFSKPDGTTFGRVDEKTNSRGEARCVVRGTASGEVYIKTEAAGAEKYARVYFSEQILTISEVSKNYVADGETKSAFSARYTQGNGAAIEGAVLSVSVTAGNNLLNVDGEGREGDFSGTFTTDGNGNISFTITNPAFAGPATVSVRGSAGGGSASASILITFWADGLAKIELGGSPDVIGTNNGKAKITATAFDAKGNRVGVGYVISFNLVTGGGGGEYLDPPTATTDVSGTASVYLVAGAIPSQFKGVAVRADYNDKKSNIVNFTVAGQPKNITVRRNIDNITSGTGGTYGMKLSALVTDVNNNPVPDGTEVTFSSELVGYRFYYVKPRLEKDENGVPHCKVDTIGVDAPSEDFSKGTRAYNPFPKFNDVNRNGFPETSVDVCNEDADKIERKSETLYINGAPAGAEYYDLYRIDGDNRLVVNETNPLVVNGVPPYDIDWNKNGVADPSTTVILTRTVQTKNGIADNELLYGQSDAWRVRVKIYAECQGLVTSSPEEFILPKADGARNWKYFE